MLVRPKIDDPAVHHRVERQSALLLQAIAMDKQRLGLPPAAIAMDENDLALMTSARTALETACNGNGTSVWDVLHAPLSHESIRDFLGNGK